MAQQRAADHSVIDGAKDRLQATADDVTAKVKETADRVQDIAGTVAEQAQEYGERAQHLVQEFRPQLEKALKEKPMAMLAGIAIVGFLLGALWKK